MKTIWESYKLVQNLKRESTKLDKKLSDLMVLMDALKLFEDQTTGK